MKQSELHEFIKENEPNICQIVASPAASLWPVRRRRFELQNYTLI